VRSGQHKLIRAEGCPEYDAHRPLLDHRAQGRPRLEG